MAIQKTEAVLLNRQDLRETSLILTFYTKDFGKIKGIVRGVRGSRAQPAGGSLEIFSHDEIVFYERKRNDIYTISQFDLIDYFNPIRQSLEKVAYAAYLAELLDSVTPLGEKNKAIFDLLLNSLKLLEGEASPKRVARIFEIKILELTGIMPALRECTGCGRGIDANARFSFRNGGLMCRSCITIDRMAVPILPGTVKFMEYVQVAPFEKASRIKVASKVGMELESVLRKFLDYHIERRLKSAAFIREIEKHG